MWLTVEAGSLGEIIWVWHQESTVASGSSLLRSKATYLTALKFSTWDMFILWKVYDLPPVSCAQRDRLSSAAVTIQKTLPRGWLSAFFRLSLGSLAALPECLNHSQPWHQCSLTSLKAVQRLPEELCDLPLTCFLGHYTSRHPISLHSSFTGLFSVFGTNQVLPHPRLFTYGVPLPRPIPHHSPPPTPLPHHTLGQLIHPPGLRLN